MRLLALAALLAAAAPQQAWAAQDEDPLDTMIVNSAWADPKNCNTTNAEMVALADALARQQALRGSCVAIRGFARDHRLFPGPAEAEAAPPAWSSPDSHAAPWLGLYGRDQSWTGPYLLVGIFEDCDTAWTGVAMGYCHDTHGPILIVAEQIRR
jgi:hypothetical protein